MCYNALMNTEQIDRFIDALESIAFGVNKIGDALSSISLYLWLPIYILIFGIVIGVPFILFLLV